MQFMSMSIKTKRKTASPDRHQDERLLASAEMQQSGQVPCVGQNRFHVRAPRL